MKTGKEATVGGLRAGLRAPPPRCSAGQKDTHGLFHQDKCCYFASPERKGNMYHFLLHTVYNDIGHLKHEIEKKNDNNNNSLSPA